MILNPPDKNPYRFETPYDDIMPRAEDDVGQTYIEIIRIYLALCDGILKPSEAAKIVNQLKQTPAFKMRPIDPCLLPISEPLKKRIIENIQTLKKYNLATADAIRSAISFTFIEVNAPLADIDAKVFAYLISHPTAPFTKVGRDLRFTPMTVLRAVKRLHHRQFLRFSCLIDPTAFGINSVMLFFKLYPDISWSDVELGLAEFPFTKGILKTAMTNSGYASFLFPGDANRVRAFSRSINRLRKTIFKEANLHVQVGTARDINFSLYHNGTWDFPPELNMIFTRNASELDVPPPHVLWCGGPRPDFTPFDYIVASQLRINSRMTQREMAQYLHRIGFQVGVSTISASLSRIRKANVIQPFIAFSGLGIPTNFCFEIICNESWRQRVLSYTSLLPASVTYISRTGIIVWLSTPAAHQADYYQIFLSLAAQDGVTSVNPIMTVGPTGSRTIDGIDRYMSPSKDSWLLDPDFLDLSKYLPF